MDELVEAEVAVPAPGEELEVLRARMSELERALREAQEGGRERLVQAELKTAAVRAGMVDLDGLKLVDRSQVALNEAGELEGGTALMERLRHDKPWLFAQASSSSRAAVPPSEPVRRKLATEMTLEEWRAARSEMLRRR